MPPQQTPSPAPQPGQPYQPAPDQTPHPQAYDFIVNPEKPPKKPLFNGTNTAMRIGMVTGGLLVLVVIFSLLKSALGGTGGLTSGITVAQDQQELIHLTTKAAQQQDLTPANKYLTATMQLSLSSAQTQLISYLAANHQKISAKTLNLSISTSLDQQLAAAETAGTYNQTLQDTMKNQLNNYVNDLQQAFQQITGKKGRALISSDYNQAQLLLNEINAPAPSTGP